jgi:hypothetical protein
MKKYMVFGLLYLTFIFLNIDAETLPPTQTLLTLEQKINSINYKLDQLLSSKKSNFLKEIFKYLCAGSIGALTYETIFNYENFPNISILKSIQPKQALVTVMLASFLTIVGIGIWDALHDYPPNEQNMHILNQNIIETECYRNILMNTSKDDVPQKNKPKETITRREKQLEKIKQRKILIQKKLNFQPRKKQKQTCSCGCAHCTHTQ